MANITKNSSDLSLGDDKKDTKFKASILAPPSITTKSLIDDDDSVMSRQLTASPRSTELQSQIGDLLIKNRHTASLTSTNSLTLKSSLSADIISSIIIQKDSLDNDEELGQARSAASSTNTATNGISTTGSDSSSVKRVAFSEAPDDVHEIPRIGRKSAAAVHKTKTRNSIATMEERRVSCQDILGITGARFLSHTFAALMPTTIADEEDYYDRLEITEYASKRSIHRAFETKLAKIVFTSSQKQDTTMQDTTIQNADEEKGSLSQFHRLRDAYECLKDCHSRRIYDGVRQSPTKYQYIRSGAFLNPLTLYENLEKATMGKRIRLFTVMVSLLFLALLTPIGSAAKVNHILEGNDKDVGWVVVLLPLWFLQFLYFMWTMVYALLIPQDEQVPKGRLLIQTTISAFTQICWFSGELFLAKQWDSSLDASYGAAFAPFYYGIGFRILGLIHKMCSHKYDAGRMVTWTYLQSNILKNRDFASLCPIDQVKFRSYYILVEPASEIENIDSAKDEEDIEQMRVMSSPQFEDEMNSFYEALAAIVGTLCLVLPLLTLIYQKVESSIDASWALVFLPLWIGLGWRLILCSRTMFTNTQQIGDSYQENRDTMSQELKLVKKSSDEETASSKGEDEQAVVSILSLDSDDSGKGKVVVLPKDPPTVLDVATDMATNATNVATNAISSFMLMPQNEESPDLQIAAKDEEEGLDVLRNENEKDAEYEYNTSNASVARARGKCFLVLLQVLMSSILVAKLEQAYGSDAGDAGFNALWIISPLIVVAGFALCFNTLVIFTAAEDEYEEETIEADNQ